MGVPVGAEEGVDVKLAIGGRSCKVTAVEAEPVLGGVGESVALTTRDQRPPGSDVCGVYEPNQCWSPGSKVRGTGWFTLGVPLYIRYDFTPVPVVSVVPSG